MTRALSILFLLLPLFSQAQTGVMRVYTVAGNDTATFPGDGRPATAAQISSDEGIWMDGKCNLYVMGSGVVRKVNTKTGIITTIAGNYSRGFSGDNGPATNAQLMPYGVYADFDGNVYIADAGNNRVRRVDAISGIITTFAGGGASLGDGGAATAAQLTDPGNVYGDAAGNIYIGEQSRMRKVNTSGIITTIAGTGTAGYSGDGGPATNAQVARVSGILIDDSGNLYFADRGNSIIRKIDIESTITTVAGIPSVFDYTGDGGPATAAKLSGPISFVIDVNGNLVIGDNQNDVIRRVDAKTKIITTIAGAGTDMGSYEDGVEASAANIHPEFMYLDAEGNIYYSCFCNKVRVIAHYNPGLNGRYNCGPLETPDIPLQDKVEIYPIPASDKLVIQGNKYVYFSIRDIYGKTILNGKINNTKEEVNISILPRGIYYVYLTNNMEIKVQKIIKE